MYVLLGAGGHAKVILDILHASHHPVLGFFDDNDKNSSFEDIPYLGQILDAPNILKKNKDIRFIIAIGSNSVREKIVSKLNDYNLKYGEAIHPSAVIGSNVHIGEGTVVMPNAVINHSAVIGTHSIINTAATVDHDCTLGNFVHVSPGAHLAGNIRIGVGTHVGIGSSVIQGIEIGSYSVIGAGAVVVKDISDFKVAVGCPAVEIKDCSKN